MLSSAVCRNDYVGNNSTATYDFTFPVFTLDDLTVFMMDTATPPNITEPSFTATGIGTSAGGTITLTAGDLATGYLLTIKRIRAITQTSDVRNQSSGYRELLEQTYDMLVMIEQQLQDQASASVQLPPTILPSTFNPALPTSIAGAESAVIVTDPTGKFFTVVPQSAFVGPAGPTGAGGPAGSPGATGPAGATGSSGPTGPTGATGATGANGTNGTNGTSYTVENSHASPYAVVAATSIPFGVGQPRTKKYIQGSGGAVVMSANPQIQAGTIDGQELMLVCCSGTNTVQTATGTGLQKPGNDLMVDGSITIYCWDNGQSLWVETSRNNI